MTQPDTLTAHETFPLTTAQEAALPRAAARSSLTIRWDLRGPVQDRQVEAALLGVIERHEILRTRFTRHAGTLRQEVLPAAKLRLGHVDIRALPIDDHAGRIDAIATSLTAAPFDLQRPPLMRATLIRTAPQRASLLVVAHRAVMDTRSAEVLGLELSAFLTGGTAPKDLPDLLLHYGDYALWERDCRDSAAAEADTEWWLARLRTTGPEPARPTGGGALGAAADPLVVPLPPRFQTRLETASASFGVSPASLVTAAAGAAAARLAGTARGVIETETDGRGAAELAPLIGPFAGPCLLPVEIRPDTSAAEHLSATSQVLTEAARRRARPLPELVAALGAEPRPLARVTFENLHPAEGGQAPVALSTPRVSVPAKVAAVTLHLRAAPQHATLTVTDPQGACTPGALSQLADATLAALDTLIEGGTGRLADLPGPRAPAQHPPAAAPALPQPRPARPTWEVVLLRDGTDASGGPVVVSINQPFLYRNFATCIAPDRTVVNLMVPDAPSLEAQRAQGYLAALDEAAALLGERFAGRPLVLMGQCIDGMTALHLARRLGDRVAFVALVDAWAPMFAAGGGPTPRHRLQAWDQSRRRWQHYLGLAARGRIGPRDLLARSGLGRRLLHRFGTSAEETAGAAGAELIVAVNRHHTEVGHRTPFPGYDGEVIAFASDSQPRRAFHTLFGWRGLLPPDTPIHRVAGWHEDALLHHSYRRIAEVIDARLDRHQRSARA